jgi:hypothetical protein
MQVENTSKFRRPTTKHNLIKSMASNKLSHIYPALSFFKALTCYICFSPYIASREASSGPWREIGRCYMMFVMYIHPNRTTTLTNIIDDDVMKLNSHFHLSVAIIFVGGWWLGETIREPEQKKKIASAENNYAILLHIFITIAATCPILY